MANDDGPTPEDLIRLCQESKDLLQGLFHHQIAELLHDPDLRNQLNLTRNANDDLLNRIEIEENALRHETSDSGSEEELLPYYWEGAVYDARGREVLPEYWNTGHIIAPFTHVVRDPAGGVSATPAEIHYLDNQGVRQMEERERQRTRAGVQPIAPERALFDQKRGQGLATSEALKVLARDQEERHVAELDRQVKVRVEALRTRDTNLALVASSRPARVPAGAGFSLRQNSNHKDSWLQKLVHRSRKPGS